MRGNSDLTSLVIKKKISLGITKSLASKTGICVTANIEVPSGYRILSIFPISANNEIMESITDYNESGYIAVNAFNFATDTRSYSPIVNVIFIKSNI